MALATGVVFSGGKTVDADEVPVVRIDGGVGGVPLGTSSYPSGATAVTAASGNVAAASAVATLPGVAAKTTYITGFEVTGAGATAASVVTITVAGTISGTLTYVLAVPAGVTTGVTPLLIEFPSPVPASAVNTAIVVTVPSLGTGNTNAAVVAHGYQL